MALAKIEDTIFSSIDRSLNAMGRGISDIFFWSLETEKGIKKGEIVEKPAEFVKHLDDMFGLGANILKREIIDRLSRSIDAPRMGNDLAAIIRHLTRN
jgi:hypothetical protein